MKIYCSNHHLSYSLNEITVSISPAYTEVTSIALKCFLALFTDPSSLMQGKKNICACAETEKWPYGPPSKRAQIVLQDENGFIVTRKKRSAVKKDNFRSLMSLEDNFGEASAHNIQEDRENE